METLNTRKFFKKFLADVKRNDLGEVKSKIDRVKSLHDEIQYSTILRYICECKYPCNEIFHIVLDNIHPFNADDVSNMMIHCAHGGRLDKLRTLMDHYPEIPLDMVKLIGYDMSNEHIPAVLDILRPGQVGNAIPALTFCLIYMNPGTQMKPDSKLCVREVTYKLVEMPQFFNKHELVYVLLKFNEWERAMKILKDDTTHRTSRCFSDSDTRSIYFGGGLETIQLLIRHYYYDAFCALDMDVLGLLFARFDLTLLEEILDMMQEKFVSKWHIQICFCASLDKHRVVNLRVLCERYPEVDMLEENEGIARHYTGESFARGERVDLVHKMFPRMKNIQ